VVEVPDFRAEPVLVQLGKLVSLVYRTRKGGDGGETDYAHDFGPDLPLLCYTIETKRLVIADGGYTVEPRGIVR
jgi:hypothetical protein